MSDINEKINNIEEELAQILEARYGREVRQSIHDSIAKCYDEATGKIQKKLIDSITTNATNAAASAKTASEKATAAETSATAAHTSAEAAAQSAKEAAASSGKVTGVKGSAESTYRTGQVDITKANIGLGNVDNTADADKTVKKATSAEQDGSGNVIANTYLKKTGDAKDVTVTYTSNDSTTAPDSTPPAVMTSGEKLSALLGKLSTFGKNVRWLLSKMGSTDISTIGDGTVTGAISTLNANWSKIGTAAIEKLGGTVPVPNSKWTSVCIYYNLQPGTYLLIAQMSSRKSIQYARLCKGLDVNSILANTPYGSGTLFCILTLTEITTASLWVYQNAESPMNFNEGEASIISVRIK